MTGRLKQTTWIVPLAIAGLVALFGWWGNIRLKQTLEDQLKANLHATLTANVNSLEIWSTTQTRVATSIAEEPELKTMALGILDRVLQPTEGRRPPTSQEVEQLVHLQARVRQLGYEVAQLVDTNCVIVASSQLGRLNLGPVSEAHTNKFIELFESDEPILITPFKPELSRRFPSRGVRGPEGQRGPGPGPGGRGPFRGRGPGNQGPRRMGDFALMQVAAPVHDSQGVVRGALALVINPTNEFTRILSVASSGESGETYAFDQTGLLISRSRFDDQLKQVGLLKATNSSSALNLRLHDPGGDLTKGFKPAETNLASQPLVRLVADAIAGEETVDVEPSRDYRGIPVVGASCWLPQLGFGVATQIDADEAYRPLRVLRLIFSALFLLLVLCSAILFVFSYANLTWQQRLNEAEGKLKQLGQYTLEEKIGEGGMGIVYRARHALMRRDTAIKLLLPDRASPDAIERFEREVCLTCQLTHPNTIQVYDYGHTPEGVFYYAMEYLRGMNLHQLVARFGPQPEGRVVYLLAQVCDSLAEAHGSGLVHRDIKPGNVFLCERGGVPDSIKVLDFGLVRQYSGPARDDLHLTGERGYVGTPGFMAPEAIKDSSRSDPRSDIYSVGALGYFLITAKYVYEAESVMEIYEMQLTTPPTPITRRTTQVVSPQFEKAILRCLDKDPNVRPQSAHELRELLLTSPFVAEWTPEARAAWWAQYRDQIFATSEADAARSPVPTVKIDFGSRMK